MGVRKAWLTTVKVTVVTNLQIEELFNLLIVRVRAQYGELLVGLQYHQNLLCNYPLPFREKLSL